MRRLRKTKKRVSIIEIKRTDNKRIKIHHKSKTIVHKMQATEIHMGTKRRRLNKGPRLADKRIERFGNRNTRLRTKGFKKGVRERAKDYSKSKAKDRIKLNNRRLHVAKAYAARKLNENVEGGKELTDAALVIESTATFVGNTDKRLIRPVAKKVVSKMEGSAIHSVQNGKSTDKIPSKIISKMDSKTKNKDSSSLLKNKYKIKDQAQMVRNDPMDISNMDSKYAGLKGKKLKKDKFKAEKLKATKSNPLTVIKSFFTGEGSVVKAVLPLLAGSLIPVILIIGVIAGVMMAVVASVYNSPFAIFLPPLSNGETVYNVTSQYYNEVINNAQTEANNIAGYAGSKIIYVNYPEDVDANGNPIGYLVPPDNVEDIMFIYMVKYGVGDTAADMKDAQKANLQKVVNDMVSYEVKDQRVELKDIHGSSYWVTYKYVNITLKTRDDMVTQYGFTNAQKEMLDKLRELGP